MLDAWLTGLRRTQGQVLRRLLPAACLVKVRLQKLLAEAGVASRRASEAIILAGRVEVNGAVVQQLGTQVDPGADRVVVDGRAIKPRRKLHVLLHKPPGYLCSRKDPGRSPLVLDLLPPEWNTLYPVGRLDQDSEGMLLLTNDGDFCLRVTHPRFGVRKVYRATVLGKVELPLLGRLVQGVRDRGETLRATRARLLSANASRSVVELELAEGRNHEVRRLFGSQGVRVERLVRVQIGSLKLGELPPGRWRVLSQTEIESFRQPNNPQAPSHPKVDTSAPRFSTRT